MVTFSNSSWSRWSNAHRTALAGTFWQSLVLLSLLFTSVAQAATSLNVQVDKNPVMLGEELRLSIQIDEKVSSSAIDFSILANDFRVGPPSVSQSMQIINGQSSQSTIWQLSLFAKTTGTFEIPAFFGQWCQQLPHQHRSDPGQPANN